MRFLVLTLPLFLVLPSLSAEGRTPPRRTELLRQTYGEWKAYADQKPDGTDQGGGVYHSTFESNYYITINCTGFNSNYPGDWSMQFNAKRLFGDVKQGKKSSLTYTFDQNKTKTIDGRGNAKFSVYFEYGRQKTDNPAVVTQFVRDALASKETLTIRIDPNDRELKLCAFGLRNALERLMEYCPLY